MKLVDVAKRDSQSKNSYLRLESIFGMIIVMERCQSG